MKNLFLILALALIPTVAYGQSASNNCKLKNGPCIIGSLTTSSTGDVTAGDDVIAGDDITAGDDIFVTDDAVVGGSVSINYGGVPGPYGLNIADAHIYHVGGGELAYIMALDSTAYNRDHPIWSLGRIIEGGVGESNYRLCYQDDTFTEQCHFVWEGRTGTWATVSSGRNSSAEGYTFPNQVDVSWRINMYPVPRVELGPNGAQAAIGAMSCATNVITVVSDEDHGFSVGDTVTESEATDVSETNNQYDSTGTPYTIASVADATHFTYAKTCTDGLLNVAKHVFSDATDVYMEREATNTLAFGVGGNDKLKLYSDAMVIQGGVYLAAPYTDNSGSPGATTIDKMMGKAAVASGATSVVVTNSTITTASVINITPMDIDTTCVTYKALAGTGSFTVTCVAAATANWRFQWTAIKGF